MMSSLKRTVSYSQNSPTSRKPESLHLSSNRAQTDDCLEPIKQYFKDLPNSPSIESIQEKINGFKTSIGVVMEENKKRFNKTNRDFYLHSFQHSLMISVTQSFPSASHSFTRQQRLKTSQRISAESSQNSKRRRHFLERYLHGSFISYPQILRHRNRSIHTSTKGQDREHHPPLR